ncbi:MAG: helix-turn-helix domain-containing protein [Planctomycetota bacterium]|nr:helix-turn-helix domain-containing protein [Planctomycetota bacterium]
MLFSNDGYVAGMKAGRPTQRPRTPFGERIAQARELAGMTQLQLAEKLGVSQEVVAYWERKPVALRAEQLAALADALNVTADSLLGRPTKQPAPKGPPGKLRQAFDRAHKLPRNQQNRIVELVEAYVDRYASKAS